MPIPHSKAYAEYKQQTQDVVNFAVVCCYALPGFKKNLETVGFSIPSPEHFLKDKSTGATLLESITDYDTRLAAYLLLSMFSYFEAYVFKLIDEFIEFHGGEKHLSSLAKRSTQSSLKTLSTSLSLEKRKLQTRYKSQEQDRYRSATSNLMKHNYRFPSELFAG